jgi:hypothetical protein
MGLPVIPQIDPSVRDIYENGQSLGNDPYAFSVFGDCQSEPDEFLGVFETDALLIESLSPELHEAVINFEGSFNRESPTSQDGTTPGALLWDHGIAANTAVSSERRLSLVNCTHNPRSSSFRSAHILNRATRNTCARSSTN